MTDSKSNTAAKIKSYVERIERLDEEKAGVAADIRDIYVEARGNGFNDKALRKLVAERKRKTDAELEADLELYRAALSEPGATLRGTAERFGVSKSKLQRLVPKNARGTEPPHDPETGEIECKVDGGEPCPKTCAQQGFCVWDNSVEPEVARAVPPATDMGIPMSGACDEDLWAEVEAAKRKLGEMKAARGRA